MRKNLLRPVFTEPGQMSRRKCELSFLLISMTCAVASAESQFDVIARRTLFVDRSLLIERLFFPADKMHKMLTHYPVVMIGPRKCGKTTNLSMIRQFFESGVDATGEVKAPNATKHYTLFKNLLIGGRTCFQEHFASVPVLQLNLAEFIVNGPEQDYRTSFCKVAHKLVKKHQYLWYGADDRGFSKEDMETYLDPQLCERKDEYDHSRFGSCLTERMALHFNANVLMLIDNVDVPALSILNSVSTSRNVKSLEDLFFFVTTTIQSRFRWAVYVTGATRQGVFLGNECLNNVHTMDAQFREFYGVTEAQLHKLLAVSDVRPTRKLMADLHQMYGWYGVSDNRGSPEVVYNTQSIIRFCEEKRIRPYWDAAAGITPFRKMISQNTLGPKLEKAMYRPVSQAQVGEVNPENLVTLRDFLSGKTKKDPNESRFQWNIMGYLWESGYVSSYPKDRIPNPDTSRSVMVPNDENRLILLDAVLDKEYYMAKHGLSGTVVDDFLISVEQLDGNETSVKRFSDCFSHLFTKNTWHDENEVIYRYALYGYLRHTVKDPFSDLSVKLAPGNSTGSDIIVTRKDKFEIYLTLTLHKPSGSAGLQQVLGDERVKELDKIDKGIKYICLGVNLNRSAKRCDVSYFSGGSKITNVKNVTRSFPCFEPHNEVDLSYPM